MMMLKKASLLIATTWLLATANLAHASYLCTVNCVYGGTVVDSYQVDAILSGNLLTDVLGDPGSPPDITLGVVLANRNTGGTFDTLTTDSILTVQMASGIDGDGFFWVIGDEETPGTLNETFRVFVSATNVFDGGGSDVSVELDMAIYNNNAFVNLSTYALPTIINYVKLQADPNIFGSPPAPMAVLGIAGQSVVSAVPVPAAVWLFGSGLLGLLGIARRRQS